MTARPSANATVLSCQPTFTLALNNTWPDPVANVSVSEPTKVLFKPVYHVWGKYQTGFDGTPFTGEDGSTGIQHYFDQYWIRELNSPNILSLTNTQLADGWYTINIEGSLTSDYPSLLSLAGTDVYDQTNVLYVSVGPGGTLTTSGISLTGKPKFNGALLDGYNGKVVGIQSTQPTLSAVQGPDTMVKVGGNAVFSWTYTGQGKSTCQVDNAVVASDASSGLCTSPFTVQVGDDRNHTLVVAFEDTCGNVEKIYFKYGASFGWSTNATTGGAAADFIEQTFVPTPEPKKAAAKSNAQHVQGSGMLLKAAVGAVLTYLMLF
eukprot:jgi/Chrzof1/1722/Cz10g18180.t1